MKAKTILAAAVMTVLLVVLAWEVAYDINDPTIPLVRELLFTAGSILGIAAWFYCLLEENDRRPRAYVVHLPPREEER